MLRGHTWEWTLLHSANLLLQNCWSSFFYKSTLKALCLVSLTTLVPSSSPIGIEPVHLGGVSWHCIWNTESISLSVSNDPQQEPSKIWRLEPRTNYYSLRGHMTKIIQVLSNIWWAVLNSFTCDWDLVDRLFSNQSDYLFAINSIACVFPAIGKRIHVVVQDGFEELSIGEK